MSIETEMFELDVGLREIATYLEIFEDYANNHYTGEKLNFVNGVISMISMQSAKIEKLIAVAEKLESEVKKCVTIATII